MAQHFQVRRQWVAGNVELRVWYTASEEEDDGKKITVLDVEYEVEMIGDEDPDETVVAVTNHRY